jgi:23S rRNA (cytidine1920-2'-O)/16S rRNA (cytidine1409-2'-O)-methyltransferase
VTKPAYAVAAGESVVVAYPEPRWVGRGARKLDHALSVWEPRGLRVRDRRCLDVGASTGGFTQVLLARGARQVVALDVGRDQLAPELRADPRVIDLPGTHVRDATPSMIGGHVEALVADLSFISLASVLPLLPRLCLPGAALVLLVKPQFEVGREALGHAGVVRSATARRHAVEAVLRSSVQAGLGIVDLIPSPVQGASGNREYLLWAAPERPGMMELSDAQARVAAITAKESR